MTCRSSRSFFRDTTNPQLFLHITGEVTNPSLLEHFITEHPMVHSAIMFGHGRYNAGVLIELGFKIDINNTSQVQETRNKLQHVIDRMNMFAPQHARVQKEMVLFATPTKPFIYTPLDSTRLNRRDTLAEYNGEINALYNAISRTARVAWNPPRIWSPQNSLAFVRGIIVIVLGKKLEDDANLFDHGTDSIEATRIRIILFHALQSTTKIDTRKLSGNAVHQYPTTASLAAFATRTALACFRDRTDSSLSRCLEMVKMVKSHSLNFPAHQPSGAQPRDDVFLITGTACLLGSHLLALFLQDSNVKRVYVLNHKKSRPGCATDWQALQLQACGLDPALVYHPKLTLLDTDASQSHLGLLMDFYDQLLSSVTHIVHNAWLSTYDDNLPLSIFNGSFTMLRNLVDFALSSPHPTPPRLLFISSTATFQGASSFPEHPVMLDGPVDTCDALGNMYGESKWVGEQILASAASETPLRPTTIRVGPLCAAINGRWPDEAILPTIVRLGVTLGALPEIDEVVHWIPIHIAAQAIATTRHSTTPYFLLTHPHPVSSLSLLRIVGEELGIPLVPLSEWITQLEECVHATPFPEQSDDHALVMLQHLRLAQDLTRTDSDDVPTKIVTFDHAQVVTDVDASFALYGGNMDPLGIADVRLWVRHWQEVGLIPTAA